MFSYVQLDIDSNQNIKAHPADLLALQQAVERWGRAWQPLSRMRQSDQLRMAHSLRSDVEVAINAFIRFAQAAHILQHTHAMKLEGGSLWSQRSAKYTILPFSFSLMTTVDYRMCQCNVVCIRKTTYYQLFLKAKTLECILLPLYLPMTSAWLLTFSEHGCSHNESLPDCPWWHAKPKCRNCWKQQAFQTTELCIGVILSHSKEGPRRLHLDPNCVQSICWKVSRQITTKTIRHNEFKEEKWHLSHLHSFVD